MASATGPSRSAISSPARSASDSFLASTGSKTAAAVNDFEIEPMLNTVSIVFAWGDRTSGAVNLM